AVRAAHGVRLDPRLRDAADVGKRLRVQQGSQAMKLLRFSLVRRGGEQKQVRRRCRQPSTKLVTSHLVRASAQTVGFVHNDQIPTGGNQVLEALTVVLGHL